MHKKVVRIWESQRQWELAVVSQHRPSSFLGPQMFFPSDPDSSVSNIDTNRILSILSAMHRCCSNATINGPRPTVKIPAECVSKFVNESQTSEAFTETCANHEAGRTSSKRRKDCQSLFRGMSSVRQPAAFSKEHQMNAGWLTHHCWSEETDSLQIHGFC